MKTITLTKGKSTIVDDDDYDWLSQWKWHTVESKRKNAPSYWYAVRKSRHRGPTVYMHSQIGFRMHGIVSGWDHIDRNGLNNTRNNLRPCDQTQNQGNRCKSVGKSSRFKGVSFFKRLGTWHAKIRYRGKEFSLKYHHDEKDAAIAYNNAAKELFGEFALLNEV